jgi:hypothetical protein
MKWTVIILVCFFTTLISCNNQDKAEQQATLPATEASAADTDNLTSIQWLDSVQQFGKVTDGEKVLITFHFKNTGTKPLVIESASPSCGCTVPEKPNEPIAPGGEGEIKAEFNSAGRVGMASKYITVVCNTPQQTYSLLFEGEVLPKK